MPSRSIRRAEKKALDGANESQDTLVVAHYLMRDYGVGQTSSSPPPDAVMSLPSPEQSRAPSENTSKKYSPPPTKSAHKTRGASATNTAVLSQPSSIPDSQDAHNRQGEHLSADPEDRHASDEDGVVGEPNPTDTLPQSQGLSTEPDVALRRRNMDSTQSTQPNTGRSYDRYLRPLSPGHTSPHARTPADAELIRSSSPAQQSLPEDDTGAAQLNFANVAATNKTVSPGQDDSGLVDFGSLARFRDLASENPARSPSQQFPETPAPPQNPFRHSRSQLLPTSQLFRGTQFSSPVKVASPTSSRPSPAGFPNDSISPNPAISSPLKARGLRSSQPVGTTSSPLVLPGTTSSKLNDAVSSPVNTASRRTHVVPESSHNERPRKKSAPEPMTTYEPMRKSQGRRSGSEVRSDPLSPGDDDDQHDSTVRRRRAMSKKKAALKQLTAISFPRPSKPDDIEVPSTSQRRRASQAEAYIAQCHGENAANYDSEGSDPVQESQERRPPPVEDHHSENGSATQSDVETEPGPMTTSTASTAAVLPASSTRPKKQLARTLGNDGTSNGDAIPETSPTETRPGSRLGRALAAESRLLEAESTPNFPSSPPAFSTRSRRGRAETGHKPAPSLTSALSNLASTPILSPVNHQGAAGIARARSPAASTIVASSSPAAAKTKRQATRGRLAKLNTASAENFRHSSRLDRRSSSSTDDLPRSFTATPTFEQSLRVSRLSASRSTSRLGRTATKPLPSQRDQKLFEGMAFAISFQSRKLGESNDQYNTRMEFAAAVQRRIKQAGGRILENGFDELFEVLPMGTPSRSPGSSPGAEAEIHLTREGYSTGFTALIADGHSRKVKYMQALALGLPCIAARWVTTCLDRNELTDWTPYLLCAGQSTFLDNAIRSRCLAPYDAATARLADVVARRPKLLEGNKILAVLKKALEGRKMAYVFLARVLGASLTRVYSVDEAKAGLKAAEDAGHPFDWVYVDGKPDEEALFATGPAGGKKRKRAPATTGTGTGRSAKKVRTLSDELVIQSLILGRLIEEGEMQEGPHSV
ncbi:hypothetical protein VTK56DRAFT_7 [Thermocarpiscus australiensis]